MSAQYLAVIIFLVVSAQVVTWAAIAFYRHLESYAALKNRAAGREDAVPAPSSETAAQATASPPSWEGFRDFRVARKVFEDENKTICSFYLVPVDGTPLPAFRPGQYLTFRLPIDDATGTSRTAVRCYSLSDRPNPDYYRVTIKRVPAPTPDVPPGLGSNHFHDKVQQGDVVSVKVPAGHFHLADKGAAPIVLVGGGIGITPMLSIVNTTLQQAHGREVWLFYGVRNRADHVMKEHLETLAKNHPNLHLHVCYSRPDERDVEGVDYQHRGHVDIRLLRLTLPRQAEDFYICGPKQMMETLVPALEEWGVPPQRIRYEAFGPASIAKQEKKTPSVAATEAEVASITVTFSRTGKRLQWDGKAESLLDFAEANGIVVDSGCRAGSCGCCQTSIQTGEVEYNQTPDADVEAGACLLCITTPKTDLILSA